MNIRTMNKKSPRYLFGARFYDHIINRAYTFDENPEYHQDGKADTGGLAMLKAISQRYSGNTYVLLVGQKLSFSHPNRLPKNAYSVFWKFDDLRQLDHIEAKLDIGGEIPFPIALVSLENFDFQVNESNYFDNGRVMYLFTDLEMKTILNMVEAWIVSMQICKGSSFDRDAMVSSLNEHDEIAFFQYCPSHNTHYESMSLVGPRSFVNNVLSPCIDEALANKVVSIAEQSA